MGPFSSIGIDSGCLVRRGGPIGFKSQQLFTNDLPHPAVFIEKLPYAVSIWSNQPASTDIGRHLVERHLPKNASWGYHDLRRERLMKKHMGLEKISILMQHWCYFFSRIPVKCFCYTSSPLVLLSSTSLNIGSNPLSSVRRVLNNSSSLIAS